MDILKRKKASTINSQITLEIVKLLEIHGHEIITAAKHKLNARGIEPTVSELHTEFMNVISKL